MSRNNCHNSILFLTTLSVYLGLVLVGASPSVLAQQAALSQKFEIQKEIENEDDLDKNPKNVDDLAKDIEIIKNLRIAEAINEFISDLGKLESIGKFDPKSDWVFLHQIWSKHFDGTVSVSKNSDIYNPWLETAVDQLILNAGAEDVSAVSDELPICNDKNCREINVTVESTANEFIFGFTFTKQTPERAKIAAEAFNEIFISKKVALKGTKNLSIYENTKSTFARNEVLVVTRLPRGSLDALFTSEKQAN